MWRKRKRWRNREMQQEIREWRKCLIFSLILNFIFVFPRFCLFSSHFYSSILPIFHPFFSGSLDFNSVHPASFLISSCLITDRKGESAWKTRRSWKEGMKEGKRDWKEGECNKREIKERGKEKRQDEKMFFFLLSLILFFPFLLLPFFLHLFLLSYVLLPSVFDCSPDSFPHTPDQMVALTHRVPNRKEEI